MKKVILIIICVIGSALLIGGTVFAVCLHSAYVVSFDKYMTFGMYALPNEDFSDEEMQRYKKCREEEWISCPSFSSGRSWGYVGELTNIYAEVDDACAEYANYVANTYKNNAKLDFTVENTGKILTIKFSGVGCPENGEPEELSRTYIFDIEGACADKLPKLLNRADIIGY